MHTVNLLAFLLVIFVVFNENHLHHLTKQAKKLVNKFTNSLIRYSEATHLIQTDGRNFVKASLLILNLRNLLEIKNFFVLPRDPFFSHRA